MERLGVEVNESENQKKVSRQQAEACKKVEDTGNDQAAVVEVERRSQRELRLVKCMPTSDALSGGPVPGRERGVGSCLMFVKPLGIPGKMHGAPVCASGYFRVGGVPEKQAYMS